MTLSTENYSTPADATPASRKQPRSAVTEVHFAAGHGPLGSVLVARTEEGVCAILLGDHPRELALDLQARMPEARLTGADALCDDYVSRVIEFIEAPRNGLDLPLDMQGTPFQKRVWKLLQSIPAGVTVTYSELAQRLDAPDSARAVARACSTNPLALAIPCHRVVGKNGFRTGYRWGVDRKRALLEKEGQS
jgi:AraC family transcriptional regulator, regulatory protein of adaptative response / methylated-DNA-[protein]-cysteine methyltransferase